MAKFEVTSPDGKKFEITAPDQQTALNAFARMQSQPQITKSELPKDNYAENLQKVRESQFPQMNDQQWAEYSQKFLAPYSLKDQAQNAQAFGFGDEIGAGMGALGSQVRQWTGGGGPGFGESYSDLKALEQSRRDVGAEKNGALGTAAEIVGGMSGFMPAATGVNAVAQSLLRRGLQSGATGAAMGGVYGAGAADKDRLQAAAQGAAVGGALGAAAEPAAAAFGSAYRNVADTIVNRGAARAVGVRPATARMLQETLAADDALGPTGMANMQRAGAEGTLADAGPSARQMLDTAVQSSGRAGAAAREQIGARVDRDAQAIHDALDNALGAPQGVETTRTQIRQDSAPARGQAYDAAYNAPIDYASAQGRQLEEMLRTRVDQNVINNANAMMRRDGTPSRSIMATIADDGTVTYQQMPDIRQIDYITRALNDRAANNAGLGAMGGQTQEGRSFQNLSNDIRGTARQAVPEYDAALQTAADPIRRSQAVGFGSQVLSPGTTREQVAQQVANMTGPERQALAQGIRSQLDDTLANVTRTVTDGDVPAREAIAALRKLSSRASREKVALAIGDGPANAMFDELDRATMSFELRASVADNSKTFARQEMKRRLGDMTEGDGPISALAKGEPVNAGKRVIQALTGQSKAHILAAQDQINQEVVQALLARGGGAVRNMQALRALQAQGGSNAAIADALMQGVRRVGVASTPYAGRRASGH